MSSTKKKDKRPSRQRPSDGELNMSAEDVAAALQSVPVQVMAGQLCALLVQAFETDETGRCRRIFSSRGAAQIFVNAIHRFRDCPDVLVPSCLLIRCGLSPEKKARHNQIQMLQQICSSQSGLVLPRLLLEINNGLLHYVAPVKTEVCALLTALGISISSVRGYIT